MRDVVLFDFGGTLDADGDRWAVRFHQAYARAGGRLAFSAFEPVFREKGFRRLIVQQGASSLVPEVGFFIYLDKQLQT